MRKNYFLSVISILLCLPLFSQTSVKAYRDSIKKLSKAANEAYNTYDYNNSIEYSLQLIRLASTKNDADNLYTGYNGLGVTYEILEDTLRAKENYEQALHYAEVSKNDTLLWYAYNNLGNIYSSNKKTIDKGLRYYEKAIDITSRLSEPKEALTPIINIAWTYLDNKQYDKAAIYLKRAWKLGSEEEDKKLQSNLLSLFGMYHSGKGEYDESRDHFQLALEVAEKDSLLVEASFAYKEYAKMLKKSGQFEEAYAALEKYQEYREETFQNEKNHQREAVYGRFETEEYKKDLAAAQREQKYKDEVIAKTRQITAVMIFSLIVMFLCLILLFRNNRIRKRLIGELKNKNNEYMAAKEEAERLSLLKTRFFSTVSHELRTPLYGVVGLTSLLLEDNENEKQTEDLKSLKFSADYLLALINDVLQMNKMESNLVQLENGSFNIEELFQGIVKSFETTRHHNRNIIELQISEDIPHHLIGDAMRLSQVMMNLVGNAVKFTEKGSITMGYSLIEKTGNSFYQFFVSDTGIGINNAMPDFIFERFGQIEPKKANNQQGTGLGLAVSKGLIELLNGKIWFESTPDDISKGIKGGSTFYFTIPASHMKTEEPKQFEINKTANMKNLNQVHILVVEDDNDNLELLRRFLVKAGAQVIIARSGNEAINAVKSNQHIKLVLMYIRLPDIDGFETTRKIKELNPKLPVIAQTAYALYNDRERCLENGCDDYISKPLDKEILYQKINHYIYH